MNPIPPSNKLAEVQLKVNVVRDQMQENVTRALDRQVLIESIDEKAIDLEKSSNDFHANAKKARQNECRKVWRTRIVVFSIVALVFGFILWIILSSKKNS